MIWYLQQPSGSLVRRAKLLCIEDTVYAVAFLCVWY